MKNKTITIDYDEWQNIQKKIANQEVIMHSRGGGYFTYMYYSGENDLIQGLRKEVNDLASEYGQRILDGRVIKSRLAKLENRNWFERLFNIDL